MRSIFHGVAGGLLLPFILLAASSPLPAQTDTPSGWVSFGNRGPQGVDARVYSFDGTTPLARVAHGTSWRVGLAWGVSRESLVADRRYQYLAEGDAAGYVATPLGMVLHGTSPGQRVFVQLVVWSSLSDSSYPIAVARAEPHGESQVIEVACGTSTQPAPLIGLQPFAIRPGETAAIRFENRVPDLVDAPVFWTNGVSLLSGPAYLAQLMVRLPLDPRSDWAPVGPPAPFGTGTLAGYWNPGTNTTRWLTNIAAGETAEIRVRVWRGENGQSYDAAVSARREIGMSESVLLTTTGAGEPPTSLRGLASFQIQSSPPGTMDFRNQVPGQLNTLITYASPSSHQTTPMEAPFVVQLFMALTSTNLQPVSLPIPFGQGSRAGLFPATEGPAVLELPQFGAGQWVNAELRIWDSSLAPTYDLAPATSIRGKSGLFILRLGGPGFGSPAILPPNLTFHFNSAVSPTHVIQFQNRVPGVLDRPVFGRDGSRLSGTNYVAQLFAERLAEFPRRPVAVTPPVPFGTGTNAGYWLPGAHWMVEFAQDQRLPIVVQVRVWDRTKGASFEAAGRENRSISNPILLFPKPESQPLVDLGYMTLQPHADSAIVIHQGPWPVFRAALDSDLPLAVTGLVAQIHVAHNSREPNFTAGHGGVPVGPVGEVGIGSRAGEWLVPNPLLIDLPWMAEGDDFRIQLRVWERAFGATYEEAARQGSRLGRFTSPEDFTVHPPETHALPEATVGWITLRNPRIRIPIPPGMHFFSNPTLGAEIETTHPGSILERAAPGTLIFLWDSDLPGYRALEFNGRWLGDAAWLPGGGGAFLFHPGPDPTVLEFEGDHGPLSALVRPVTGHRFHARGNTLGRPANFQEVTGLAPIDGDAVFTFSDGRWVIHPFEFGAWDGGDLTLAPYQAAFIRLNAAP